MSSKKKCPIFIYFIGMIFLFLVVLIGQQIFASGIQEMLETAKFGSEAIFEILWAGFVLVILLLFKNKYVFTQKQEGYFASFKYIVPELVLSGIFLLISLVALVSNNYPLDMSSVYNLALYCLFIGIVEEFLCRGWLLNEFLERYSDTKKEIILSIIFSSFIFGVIHFLNLGDTQGFAETLVQVMNAAAGGIFLALVYYKTKNIWVVVTSHAIWDFSLFLSEANSLGDCLSGVPSSAMVVTNIVRGIVLTGAYLCFSYWIYTKTDLYDKEQKKSFGFLVPVGVVTYILGLLFINVSTEGYYTCPDYTRKKIDDPYRVAYYNYSSYYVNNYSLVLKPEKGKIVLFDEASDESLVLVDRCYDYLLIDNDESFSILIKDGDNTVLYGNYSKNDITYGKDYLKSVKDGLERHVVTEISGLGTLSIQNSEYKYPVIQSNIGEYLYFDKDNKLYINR